MLLGAGGMGEVYRARDTRLAREVAIKILPVDLSRDPRLELRFDREAKALSSLNHPNICALHDVGEIETPSGPLQYLVMELLEGRTLEDSLKKGPLPIEQVIQYATEIAAALDRAHRQGILHRDLKPANIMITKTGARLFDFGLAKTIRPPVTAHPSESQPTGITAPYSKGDDAPVSSLTSVGSVMGTLEYMAPEQLLGQEPDARTDVFAFGVCLYQMITGRRPFQGTTREAVISAILEAEPVPISTYRKDSPPSLEWLVTNCVAKDRDDRVQTAHDVMLELRRIAGEPREAALAAPRKSRMAAVVTLLVLVGVAFAVAVGLWRNWGGARGEPVRRFSIALSPAAAISDGRFEQIAVSPDGTRIAYVASGDSTSLYLYSIETQKATALPDTEGARGPFFSPNSDWVGFYTASRDLKKIPVSGGSPTLLIRDVDLRGAAWGPDNSIVFAENRAPLRRISASGGPVNTLLPYNPQEQVRWPSFLPDGESLLYTVNDFSGDYEKARLVVRSLKSGQTKTIVNGATFGRYGPAGHLTYYHSQMLFTVPFDSKRLEVTGPPVPVINDCDSYFALGLAHYAISKDGAIFYLPRTVGENERELVWVDRTGASAPIDRVHRYYEDPKLSPDATRILTTIGPRPRSDIWLYDIPRGNWQRLTTEATNESGIWSPDGNAIAFASNIDGAFDLYIVPSDLSAAPRRITSRRSWDFPKSWSPDGKSIAVVEQYRSAMPDIFMVAPREGSIPSPYISTPFDEHEAQFSPDGKWIAYQSNESGRDEIYVQSYPRSGRKWVVSTSGGINPVWRRDGKELFYRSANRMMSVSTETGSGFTAGKPQVLFKGDYDDYFDVTPDGQRFVMIKVPRVPPRTEIKVVLGLFNKQ